MKPERLGERLWRPGVRDGVLPGSEFHQVEYFGPVLGLMSATTLDEAIAWQNGTAFGLTAGLHSLEATEIQAWLDRVEAGNVYVNRSITGAIVRRQPFGGWKRSAVGPGAKAGGPDYLMGFGRWEPAIDADSAPPDAAASDDAWLAAARASDRAALGGGPRRGDQRAALSPRPRDGARRGRPRPRRPARGRRRVRRRLPATFSFARVRRARGPPRRRRGRQGLRRGGHRPRADARLLADAGGSHLAVYEGPSVPAGRVALLPYLREQSVSITNHRFGHPSRLTGGLVL